MWDNDGGCDHYASHGLTGFSEQPYKTCAMICPFLHVWDQVSDKLSNLPKVTKLVPSEMKRECTQICSRAHMSELTLWVWAKPWIPGSHLWVVSWHGMVAFKRQQGLSRTRVRFRIPSVEWRKGSSALPAHSPLWEAHTRPGCPKADAQLSWSWLAIGDTLNWMLKKLRLLHNGSNRRVIAVYCNTQTVPLTRMMGGCSVTLLLAKDLTNMLCKWRRSNRENI